MNIFLLKPLCVKLSHNFCDRDNFWLVFNFVRLSNSFHQTFLSGKLFPNDSEYQRNTSSDEYSENILNILTCRITKFLFLINGGFIWKSCQVVWKCFETLWNLVVRFVSFKSLIIYLNFPIPVNISPDFYSAEANNISI